MMTFKNKKIEDKILDKDTIYIDCYFKNCVNPEPGGATIWGGETVW